MEFHIRSVRSACAILCSLTPAVAGALFSNVGFGYFLQQFLLKLSSMLLAMTPRIMSTCAADANRAARFGCVTKALYLKAEGAQFATAVHVASLHVGHDAHCNNRATIARTTTAELPLLNERAAAVHTQRSMARTTPHDTHHTACSHTHPTHPTTHKRNAEGGAQQDRRLHDDVRSGAVRTVQRPQ